MTTFSKNNKISLENIPNFSNSIIGNPYVATTAGITVTVWPEFVDSKISTSNDLYIWAYHVRIDNNTDEQVQLLNRHWRIIDEVGITQEVDGEGVVGEQPLIEPHKSYQYSSGVHLKHPSGIMTGQYRMLKQDGQTVSVRIPTFSLDIPTLKPILN